MSATKDLVQYITESIVENPDAVIVTEKRYGRDLIYELEVAQEDMGRVIGKRGRMANAIRTLLRVAAVKTGSHVSLEINE